MSTRKVAHLTSAHPRYDARIFLKQCRSLASHGYDVMLVVADGKGNERKDGVQIFDVGRLAGRVNRMLKTTRQVLHHAVALDASIYHLHDPELLPVGLRLKQMHKKVVFDSHEDVPRQLLGKPYLGTMGRSVLPRAVALYEGYACRRFNGVIAATPFIRDKFLPINRHTVDVNNFPLLGELNDPGSAITWEKKVNEVCYVGGLSTIRGVREIVQACGFLTSSVSLNLVGQFSEPGLHDNVRADAGWSRVNELGYLDRGGVRDVMKRSIAGLVTLYPLINYLDALPVKMFEYMAAGIPVIASDFPLWREIVNGNHCGLCVNPLDPKAIAGAIDYLATNPETARHMGENGRKAVLERYNWSIEEDKLYRFYAALA